MQPVANKLKSILSIENHDTQIKKIIELSETITHTDMIKSSMLFMSKAESQQLISLKQEVVSKLSAIRDIDYSDLDKSSQDLINSILDKSEDSISPMLDSAETTIANSEVITDINKSDIKPDNLTDINTSISSHRQDKPDKDEGNNELRQNEDQGADFQLTSGEEIPEIIGLIASIG